MNLVRQAAKYGTVGVFNTVVGLAVIYACMGAGLGDVAANALGYLVGLSISYALNARWTFDHKGVHASALPRFILVVCVAYGANLVVMLGARDWAGINSYVAQLAGVFAYLAVGFFGSRVFAFVR